MIEPAPPQAAGALPWDEPVADPVAALAEARRECGDTFVVDSGDDRYLFVFSADGVRSFYALPEAAASKGVADWMMLRRKLPDELFAGRRTLPHQLFGVDDTSRWLGRVDHAIAVQLAELGEAEQLDVFAFTRRFGHRAGLASWAGVESASGARFDELVEALDRLDGADAFVHPNAMPGVAAAGKAVERIALTRAEELLGATLDERDRRTGPAEDDLFTRIVDAWADSSGNERRQGIARDVVLVHLASMSNLFAALGWAIVDLVRRPHLVEQIRRSDGDLLARCLLESIRLAQRSIMMRRVLKPVELFDGVTTYAVPLGVTIATLLPLTNTTAAAGLDRFDPGRWQGRRLADHPGLAARELVATFGHGAHTCPAQPFSLRAMSAVVHALLDTYELEPGPDLDRAAPVTEQIGGVGRPAGPCVVRCRRRPQPGRTL